MIVLSPTTTLQAVLSDVVDTNECQIMVGYVTRKGGSSGVSAMTEVPGCQLSVTDGATPVTIMDAPADGIGLIQSLDVYNADVAAVTVYIQMLSGSDTYILRKKTLQPGEAWGYERGRGWDDALTVGSGNSDITGTLDVSGAVGFADNVSVGGTLDVTGASTVDDLTVGGAMTVAETLGVTGVTTVDVLNQSAANAITAHAGGGQASATALTKFSNRVTVCASNNDSVKLPAATAGRSVFVKNASANTLDIYPASGEVINALSADASYQLATVKGALFICSVAGTWDTILTA